MTIFARTTIATLAASLLFGLTSTSEAVNLKNLANQVAQSQTRQINTGIKLNFGGGNQSKRKNFGNFLPNPPGWGGGNFQPPGWGGGHCQPPTCPPGGGVVCPPPPPQVCYVYYVYYYHCECWKLYGTFHDRYSADQATYQLQSNGYRTYMKLVAK